MLHLLSSLRGVFILQVDKKVCSTCKVAQPYSEFFKDKRHRDGYIGVCKTCRNKTRQKYRHERGGAAKERAKEDKRKEQNPMRAKEKHYRWTYGITLKEYDAMWERQGKSCALCGITEGYRFVIDHDHADGKVRGILCNPCNVALGLLKEDVALFKKAIKDIS